MNMDAPHSQQVRPRVFMLDDEDLNVETFRRAFRREFDIECTNSTATGLQMIREKVFDVALIDYAMPRMNGIEFAILAANIRPTMVRLMVTAHDGARDVTLAATNGIVSGIVAKPWKKEDILRWVSVYMKMTSMRQSVERVNEGLARK